MSINRQAKIQQRDYSANMRAGLEVHHNMGKNSFSSNMADLKAPQANYDIEERSIVREMRKVEDQISRILDLPVDQTKVLMDNRSSVGSNVRVLMDAGSTRDLIQNMDQHFIDLAKKNGTYRDDMTDRQLRIEGLAGLVKRYQDIESALLEERTTRASQSDNPNAELRKANEWVEGRRSIANLLHKLGKFVTARNSEDNVLALSPNGQLLHDKKKSGVILTGAKNRPSNTQESNLNPSKYIAAPMYSPKKDGMGEMFNSFKWRMVKDQGEAVLPDRRKLNTGIPKRNSDGEIETNLDGSIRYHRTINPVARGIVIGLTDAKAKEVALDVTPYLESLVAKGILIENNVPLSDYGNFGQTIGGKSFTIDATKLKEFDAEIAAEWHGIHMDILKSQTFLGSDNSFKFKLGSLTESVFDYINFKTSKTNGKTSLEAFIDSKLVKARVTHLLEKKGLSVEKHLDKKVAIVNEALIKILPHLQTQSQESFTDNSGKAVKGKIYDAFFDKGHGIMRFNNGERFTHQFSKRETNNDNQQMLNDHLEDTISNLALFHVQRSMDSGYKFMKAKEVKDSEGNVIYSELAKLATKYISGMLHTETSALTSDFRFFTDALRATPDMPWDVVRKEANKPWEIAKQNSKGQSVHGLHMSAEKDGTPRIVRKTFVFDERSMLRGMIGDGTESRPFLTKDIKGKPLAADFNTYINKAISNLAEGNVDGATIHFKPNSIDGKTANFYTAWDFAAHVNGQNPDFALKTRWLKQIDQDGSQVGTIYYKHGEHQQTFNHYKTLQEAMNSTQAEIDPIGAVRDFMFSRLWDQGITSLSNSNSFKGAGTHTPYADGRGVYGEVYHTPGQDGTNVITPRNERYGTINPDGSILSRGIIEVPIIGTDAMWFHGQKQESADDAGRLGFTANNSAPLALGIGKPHIIKEGAMEFGANVDTGLLAANNVFTIDQLLARLTKQNLSRNAGKMEIFNAVRSGAYDPVRLNSGKTEASRQFHEILNDVYKKATDVFSRNEDSLENVNDDALSNLLFFLHNYTEPITKKNAKGKEYVAGRRIIPGKETSFKTLNPLIGSTPMMEYFNNAYVMKHLGSAKGVKTPGSYSVFKPDIDAPMAIYRGIEKLKRDMDAETDPATKEDLQKRLETMEGYYGKIKESGKVSLNEPIVFISEDLAQQFGYQMGDRTFVGAMPKDSAVPDVPLIIGGIIEGQKNSMSIGSELGFIMGKDHDIDALTLLSNKGEAEGFWKIDLDKTENGKTEKVPVDSFDMYWNAAFADKWHMQEHVAPMEEYKSKVNAHVYKQTKGKHNSELNPFSPTAFKAMREKVGSVKLGSVVTGRSKMAVTNAFDDFNMRKKAMMRGEDPFAIDTNRAGRQSRKELNWLASLGVMSAVDMFDTSPVLDYSQKRVLGYVAPSFEDYKGGTTRRGPKGWTTWDAPVASPALVAADRVNVARGKAPDLNYPVEADVDYGYFNNTPFDKERIDEEIAYDLQRDVGPGLLGDHWADGVSPGDIHAKATLAEMFLENYSRFSSKMLVGREDLKGNKGNPEEIAALEKMYIGPDGNPVPERYAEFVVSDRLASVVDGVMGMMSSDGSGGLKFAKPDFIDPFEAALASSILTTKTPSEAGSPEVGILQTLRNDHLTGTFARIGGVETAKNFSFGLNKGFGHLSMGDAKNVERVNAFVANESRYFSKAENYMARAAREGFSFAIRDVIGDYQKAMSAKQDKALNAFPERVDKFKEEVKARVRFNQERYDAMEQSLPIVTGVINVANVVASLPRILKANGKKGRTGTSLAYNVKGKETYSVSIDQGRKKEGDGTFHDVLKGITVTVKKGEQESTYDLTNLDDWYSLQKDYPDWYDHGQKSELAPDLSTGEASDAAKILAAKAWMLKGKRDKSPNAKFISFMADHTLWQKGETPEATQAKSAEREQAIKVSTDVFIAATLGNSLIADAVSKSSKNFSKGIDILRGINQVATSYERFAAVEGKELFGPEGAPIPSILLKPLIQEEGGTSAYMQPLTTAIADYLDASAVRGLATVDSFAQVKERIKNLKQFADAGMNRSELLLTRKNFGGEAAR